MSSSCLVALPRLHPELLSPCPAPPLPPGVMTLWPGLPDRFYQAETGAETPARHTEMWFRPEYPWSPAAAAACLADFERLTCDGASGSPVAAASAEALLAEPTDLSPVERRALSAWKEHTAGLFGAPVPTTAVFAPDDGTTQDRKREEQERRCAAQRVLLLCWLRETQYLEMARLEAKICQGQIRLASWLDEGETGDGQGKARAEKHAFAASELSLPPWSAVWEAAHVFLPPEAVVVVTDAGMAEAVQARGQRSAALPGGLAVPDGWEAVRVCASSGRYSDAVEDRFFLCPTGKPC